MRICPHTCSMFVGTSHIQIVTITVTASYIYMYRSQKCFTGTISGLQMSLWGQIFSGAKTGSLYTTPNIAPTSGRYITPHAIIRTQQHDCVMWNGIG